MKPLHKKLYQMSNQLCRFKGGATQDMSYRSFQNNSVNSISRVEQSPELSREMTSPTATTTSKSAFNAEYLEKLNQKLLQRKSNMD